MITLIAPFAGAGLAALLWALFMASPNPLMLGLAVLVTGMFFINLVTYNRWNR